MSSRLGDKNRREESAKESYKNKKSCGMQFGNAWRKIASMPKKFAQVTRSETNERRGTHAQKLIAFFSRNRTVRVVSKLYFEKMS